MGSSFEVECDKHFKRFSAAKKTKTNDETGKARDENIARHKPKRSLTRSGDNYKSYGSNVISNLALDHAMIKAYANIPLPLGREFDAEYHFLMYLKSGFYSPSKHFLTPRTVD